MGKNENPELLSEEYKDGWLIRTWKIGGRVHITRNPTNLSQEEYEWNLRNIKNAAIKMLAAAEVNYEKCG